MISLPTDLTAEFLKDVVYQKNLVTLAFDSETLRYTDCDQNIPYNGIWYESHPIKFTPINMGTSLEAFEVRIRLSNIDKKFSTIVLSEDVRNKVCQIDRVYLDNNLKVIGAPVLSVYGYLDEVIKIRRRDYAEFSISDEMIEWGTPTPRRMHDEHCAWKDFGGMECQYGWPVLNGAFDSWASSSNADNWTETLGSGGSVTQESTYKWKGAYSAKIIGGSASSYMAQTVTLNVNRKYRLFVRHRESADGAAIRRIDVRSSDSGHYLKEDGTWSATAYYLTLPCSTRWREYSPVDFYPDSGHTSYIITPYAGTGETVWFDQVDLAPVIFESGVWCDRTKTKCVALSNKDNFGGHSHVVELMDKEIWWGRVPKSFLNRELYLQSRGH